MKTFTATKYAVAFALTLLIAIPAVAERSAQSVQPRESGIVRIAKIAKRILGISTTSDLPTVPKP